MIEQHCADRSGGLCDFTRPDGRCGYCGALPGQLYDGMMYRERAPFRFGDFYVVEAKDHPHHGTVLRVQVVQANESHGYWYVSLVSADFSVCVDGNARDVARLVRSVEPPTAWGAVLPTGVPELDRALGVGGLPKGRLVEVFGPESSGKTTLILKVIAAVQASGGTAAYVDSTYTLDVAYAEGLGIDLGRLLVSQPDSEEQALEVADALVRSGAVDLVVVGSVASPDADPLAWSRRVAQALRTLTTVAARTGTTVVFVNRTPTVGNAFRFYSSIRVELTRTGDRVRVRVVKNKLAPPFQEAEFDLPNP